MLAIVLSCPPERPVTELVGDDGLLPGRACFGVVAEHVADELAAIADRWRQGEAAKSGKVERIPPKKSARRSNQKLGRVTPPPTREQKPLDCLT